MKMIRKQITFGLMSLETLQYIYRLPKSIRRRIKVYHYIPVILSWIIMQNIFLALKLKRGDVYMLFGAIHGLLMTFTAGITIPQIPDHFTQGYGFPSRLRFQLTAPPVFYSFLYMFMYPYLIKYKVF